VGSILTDKYRIFCSGITNAKNAVAKIETETNKIVDAINQLMQNDWKQWRADVEKMEKPLFKEIEKL
jgi:hypothetical protein